MHSKFIVRACLLSLRVIGMSNRTPIYSFCWVLFDVFENIVYSSIFQTSHLQLLLFLCHNGWIFSSISFHFFFLQSLFPKLSVQPSVLFKTDHIVFVRVSKYYSTPRNTDLQLLPPKIFYQNSAYLFSRFNVLTCLSPLSKQTHPSQMESTVHYM